MTEAAAIALDEVSRRYGRRWALRSVTGHFDRGQLTAVIGHNGAGKSTLLGLLAGRMRATEGHIRVLGAPINGYPPQIVRRRLGVLGHEPFVYPDLTGIENLTFFARLCGRPGTPDALMGQLAEVGLDLAALRAARTYSRGMLQRLGLARMLWHRPDVWLLDEPTTGLDQDGRAMVLGALRRARDGGACLVTVTHRVDSLGDAVDRVLSLDNGRVASWGPP